MKSLATFTFEPIGAQMRIVFIGAGSVVFTRNLTRDILTFPELQVAEIVLMDIDADRLRVPQSS